MQNRIVLCNLYSLQPLMGHMKCGARPVSAHLSTLLNCHKKVYTTTFKNINCDLFSALKKKSQFFIICFSQYGLKLHCVLFFLTSPHLSFDNLLQCFVVTFFQRVSLTIYLALHPSSLCLLHTLEHTRSGTLCLFSLKCPQNYFSLHPTFHTFLITLPLVLLSHPTSDWNHNYSYIKGAKVIWFCIQSGVLPEKEPEQWETWLWIFLNEMSRS